MTPPLVAGGGAAMAKTGRGEAPDRLCGCLDTGMTRIVRDYGLSTTDTGERQSRGVEQMSGENGLRPSPFCHKRFP
jgi:hypothetical protein